MVFVRLDKAVPALRLVVSPNWHTQRDWLRQHRSLELRHEHVCAEVDVVVRGLPAFMASPPEPIIPLLGAVKQAWQLGGTVHFAASPVDIHIAPPTRPLQPRDCLVAVRRGSVLRIHHLSLPVDWFDLWTQELDESTRSVLESSPAAQPPLRTGTLFPVFCTPLKPLDTPIRAEPDSSSSTPWVPAGFQWVDQLYRGMRWLGLAPSLQPQPGTIIDWRGDGATSELHVSAAELTHVQDGEHRSIPVASIWPPAPPVRTLTVTAPVAPSLVHGTRQSDALHPSFPEEPRFEDVVRLGWSRAQTVPVSGSRLMGWGSLSPEQTVVVTDAGVFSFGTLAGRSPFRRLRSLRNSIPALGFQRLLYRTPSTARVRLCGGTVLWGVPGERHFQLHSVDEVPGDDRIELPQNSEFVDGAWLPSGPLVLYRTRGRDGAVWYLGRGCGNGEIAEHYRVPMEESELQLTTGGDVIALTGAGVTQWFLIENERLRRRPSFTMVDELPVGAGWLARVGISVDATQLVAMRFTAERTERLATIRPFWWEVVAATADPRGGLHLLERTERDALQYLYMPATTFVGLVARG